MCAKCGGICKHDRRSKIRQPLRPKKTKKFKYQK